MASRRVWTWPTRGEPGSQGIQTPKFVLVASQELENTQEPAKEKPLEPETPSTRLRKLSHSLGLESLYILFQEVQGHVFTEQKKIAILGDMRSACLVSLLHILPTTASFFLFIWNWRGYYIGSELSGPSGEDGLKFLGLQVAAKMLELLSMASLSTILFALVRKQLVSNSLPFGAVTAGFEFTKLSLLWSKEFVATCASDVTKFSSTSSKAILITTIVVFTLLGAAIGPSAAVASQPVLRNWPAGGTTFWLNATSQDLWPTQLDKMSPSDIPCNYSQSASCFPLNYNLLAGGSLSHWPSPTEHSEDGGAYLQVIPERVLISGRQSMITLATRFRGPFIYEPELTVSTAPLSTISDALSQYARYWFIANQINCIKKKESFCYYNDIFHSIDAIQPVTYVKCSQSNVGAPINFPRLDQGSGKYPQILYNNTILGSRQWFDNSTSNGTSPALAWAQLPEADFGNLSVGAVVALPSSSTGIPDQVFGCTVDARWANATSTVSFLGGPEVASGLPTNWFLGGQRQLRHDGQPLWPQIKLGPEWGNSINPSIENSSKSVFATLCNSVGRLSDITLAPPPINAIEAVLTVMITDGLSRTSSMATILGSLKDLNSEGWINEILPKHSVFGSGGSAFNYSYQGGDQSTKLEAKTTVNGYGYGITTATALSTFVLLIYSVIAIVYVFYSIIFTQTTSSSWESIAELVALALNSGPTSAMQNTSAGIATLGTLKQPVKVRVKDEHLQMVFEEGKDREGGHKIAADGYYG